MGRDRWHVIEEDGGLILTRRLPVRFDLAVEGWLPEAPRARVAHRLRQDMWRELQNLRAGGAVAARFARASAEARIAALFRDPARVARWTGAGR